MLQFFFLPFVLGELITTYVHSGIRIDTKSLNWTVGGEADRGSFGEIDGRDHSIKTYLGLLSRHRVSN